MLFLLHSRRVLALLLGVTITLSLLALALPVTISAQQEVPAARGQEDAGAAR